MRSVRHTSGFTIDQPVARVFHLMSPESEKAWVPGWDNENVMGTTELSEDYVFVTRSHDHAAAEAIWLVQKYEPDNGLIELYRVEPEQKVGVITVQCSETREGQSYVEATYEYIPLSEEGRKFVEGFTVEAYEQFTEVWHDLLVRYFESIR